MMVSWREKPTRSFARMKRRLLHVGAWTSRSVPTMSSSFRTIIGGLCSSSYREGRLFFEAAGFRDIRERLAHDLEPGVEDIVLDDQRRQDLGDFRVRAGGLHHQTMLEGGLRNLGAEVFDGAGDALDKTLSAHGAFEAGVLVDQGLEDGGHPVALALDFAGDAVVLPALE